MRFTCPSSSMLQGLAIATRALSSRSTQPIYEGVMLKTYEDGVQLTCSDGSMSIVTMISATVLEEGSAILPGKLLHEVIRKLPDAELTASMNANYMLTLRCVGSRTTIAGQPADLYPELPSIDTSNTFEMPQPMLKNMIQQTAFAISTDESRMVLTGSLLEVSGGEVRLVSLDGFRLALRLERISDVERQLSAVIPGKTLLEIAKVMSDSSEDMASIVIKGSQMMISMGRTQLYSTLIEGEFIKYRQILPHQFKTLACVDKQSLNMCVDRASLMARDGKSNLIRMKVADEQIIITSNSESGDVYEEMDAKIDGDGLNIAFNVKYISDVMRVLTEEQVEMCFNTSVSPCLIRSVSGDAYVYLVLPVRVDA